jgi:type I restriction enzyme S subunit
MIKMLCKIQLREILVMQKGTKPSILNKKEFDGSVPYLDINALETGIIKEYTYKELGNISEESDVLVVWDGSRSGLCFKGKFGAIGSTMMRLTPLLFSSEYIYYFIKSKFSYINNNTKGNSIPHVDQDIFFDIHIPYVPLEKQNQVVSLIEKKLHQKYLLLQLQKNNVLNTLTDINVEYEHNDGDILQSFENFKQALLTHAFSGQLSSDFRNKNLKSKFKKTELVDYEPYLTEFSIPDSWHWINLRNISQISVGSTPKRSIKAYWDGNIPWVSSGELKNSYIFDTKEKVTQLGVKATNLKILEKDTLLMAMVGEGKTRGKVALLKIPAATNQNICAISLIKNINPKFIFYYFQLRYKEIRNGSINARSSSSQSSLNSIIIGKFNICLPDYEEQCFIVNLIDEIFSLVDKLSSEFEQAQSDLIKLENSILNEAFIFSYEENTDQNEKLTQLRSKLEFERAKIEQNRKEIRKSQAKFKKEHFMKNTTDNIISELKKKALKLFKNKNISNEDKIKLFENLQSTIPGMDFDDFSIAFQELAQEKLHTNEAEPFFISKNISGKLHHIINTNENSIPKAL